MDEVCRLCCSTNFVNNDIFDEENALYLKMSLYLPIKVFKNDRLPQRVCDKCSCKVNDLYQFCNETIAVQHRLRAVLISNGIQLEDSIDLTLIKHNDFSPAPIVNKVEPHDQSDHNGDTQLSQKNNVCEQSTQTEDVYNSLGMQPDDVYNRFSTQVEDVYRNLAAQNGMEPPPFCPIIKVKQEPGVCKQEIDDYSYYQDQGAEAGGDVGGHSDCSSDDNVSLSMIKRERKKRKKRSQCPSERKKKPKLKELRALVGTALALVPALGGGVQPDSEGTPAGGVAVKTEPLEYTCCICFMQCYTRTEMLQHYKAHLSEALSNRGAPPDPPPPPPTDPVKCVRCSKTLSRAEWGAHWLAHWERDARPLRCALCEKTFRDHAQVLRHGLTHKLTDGAEGSSPPGKRFACDVCGEAFVYMRCLLAHRLRAHPEHAAKALAARCAICNRTFAHLNSLRRHLRAHTGERNFLCSVCGKALSSREHLKFHLRIHANYKPNVCKTCGKGFVKKCNLTLHERVHSGEKPHVCAHCGKAFSQRSTLVIHERYHSGARPYVCALCGRGFVAKGLLSMHLKTTCI